MFSSVQSLSRVSSLQPHELQHARPPCPSPTPRVHPNPCPLSQWCHPTISSSVIPFSSCPQSFPASGAFPMSQLFTSGGQSIGVSASASVLPMNTQDWSALGWTGWISLQSRDSQELSPTPWMFTKLIVAILWYNSYHYTVHLKFIQCYMSIIFNKTGKNKINFLQIKKSFWFGMTKIYWITAQRFTCDRKFIKILKYICNFLYLQWIHLLTWYKSFTVNASNHILFFGITIFFSQRNR